MVHTTLLHKYQVLFAVGNRAIVVYIPPMLRARFWVQFATIWVVLYIAYYIVVYIPPMLRAHFWVQFATI